MFSDGLYYTVKGRLKTLDGIGKRRMFCINPGRLAVGCLPYGIGNVCVFGEMFVLTIIM